MITILYIPAPRDPHGILADGLCGARPPKVTHGNTCSEWRAWQGACACGAWALPLSWRGELVPEAIDRLTHRLAAARWPRIGRPKLGYSAQFESCAGVLYNPSNPLDQWWLSCSYNDVSEYIAEQVPLEHQDHALPWALATIAARELGGRVEVVP